MTGPSANASYWLASTPETSYPALAGDVRVDVAVVGGGITGITAALLLKDAGRTVALVEAKRILRGATGYTTAKITAGHTLIYDHLLRRFGERKARLYADANQAAVEWIADVVERRGIECDFERSANFVYSEDADAVDELKREATAAARLGLPATFTRETDLPYPVAGAVRLDGQAQFHPLRYLLPLTEAIEGDGSRVFEETRALDVEEEDGWRVVTDRGSVRARDVVVATHLPFLDRGLFFAKAHPYRAYVLALPVDAEAAPRGMYITSTRPTRSLRTTPFDDRRLILLAGDGHKTGEEADTRARYAALERFARERLGLSEVAYRWSTQDYYTVDKVPYVGDVRRGSRGLYAATGFNGWGMTGGTVSALLLADLVLGRKNAWTAVFDAKRLAPRASARMFVKENAKAAAHWVADGVRPAEKRAAELGPGEAAVVRGPGERVAVYRDEQGALHAVTAVCSHLACIVRWNAAEQTWDCPCHGSRFRIDGTVVQGPAVRDLPRRDPQDVLAYERGELPP